MRVSLPVRILALSLFLLVLPLLVIAFVEFETDYRTAVTNAKKQLSEGAQAKAIPLSQLTASRLSFLSAISFSLNIADWIPYLPNEKANETLTQLVKIAHLKAAAIHKIIGPKEFRIVASSDPNYIGLNFYELFKFLKVLEKKYVQIFAYDTSPPHEMLYASLYVIDSPETRKPSAVFALAFPIEKFLKETLVPLTSPYLIQFAVVSPHKIVMAASDERLNLQYFTPLSAEVRNFIVPQSFANIKVAEKPLDSEPIPSEGFFTFNFLGRKNLAYALKISGSDDYIISYTDQVNITEASKIKFFLTYLIYGFFFVVGSLIAILLTRRMAKPFHQLLNVMTRIRQKDFAASYQTDPLGFEINTLGSIFNETINSLLTTMRHAQQEQLKRELLENELKIGRDVQRQLLPQIMPSYPHVELAGFFRPAKEVGGDFYDAFIHGKGEESRLILTIADTSGKGISACLYSLGVRSLLRGFGKEFSGLKKVISLTNNTFCEETAESGMFVTLFICGFDSNTRELSYISAGHNPPFVIKKNKTVLKLENHGLAIGLETGLSSQERKIILEKDDILLLYTDGITEAHNKNNELFGKERFIRFLEAQTFQSANEVIEKLLNELESFAEGAAQHDDMTLLAMRILE